MTAVMPFKVIQGYNFRYQSKARIADYWSNFRCRQRVNSILILISSDAISPYLLKGFHFKLPQLFVM